MTQTVQGLNLKNIVDDFQLLADRHKQINSFGFGDTDEFTYQVDRRDKEVNPSDQAPYYPYFYVVPSNVIQEFNFMTYEFQLIVSDIMKRDMDNMTDILSDTLQIMNDIISMFRLSYTEANGNYNEFYYVDEAVTLIPFIERYEDLLCGYSATLRIKTRTPLDRCVAAFNEFPSNPCISPSPTTTSTPTPTITPTNTATPSPTPTCPAITTQYVKGEILPNGTTIRGSLWNDSGFTSSATAICIYDALFSFTGSQGTIRTNVVENFQTGEHNDVYNASPDLQPGETLTNVVINSVIPQCPCINIILPSTPSPTPTPTTTQTPTNKSPNSFSCRSDNSHINYRIKYKFQIET